MGGRQGKKGKKGVKKGHKKDGKKVPKNTEGGYLGSNREREHSGMPMSTFYTANLQAQFYLRVKQLYKLCGRSDYWLKQFLLESGLSKHMLLLSVVFE